jgi:hypothetical protein
MTQNPGQWVDHSIHVDNPWLSNDGPVKVFELVDPAPGMSIRSFHLYWRNHHSPHVMNVTGFSQYIRKYSSTHRLPTTELVFPLTWSKCPYEGLAELTLDSVDELNRLFAHPAYAELIADDEARFIGDIEIAFMKHRTLFDSDPDLTETNLVKLVFLLSASEALDRNGFHLAVVDHARRLIEYAAPLRAATAHRLAEPSGIVGMPEPSFDATIELWFNSIPAAQELLLSQATTDSFDHNPFAQRAKTRVFLGRLQIIHDELSFQGTSMQPLSFSWK